jgi:hypothetical protein
LLISSNSLTHINEHLWLALSSPIAILAKNLIRLRTITMPGTDGMDQVIENPNSHALPAEVPENFHLRFIQKSGHSFSLSTSFIIAGLQVHKDIDLIRSFITPWAWEVFELKA